MVHKIKTLNITKFIFIIINIHFIFLSYSGDALGCTAFCLSKSPDKIVGQSYEWFLDKGLIFISKRGVRKEAVLIQKGQPAFWTSKYGSVTFSQYGREMPAGGMNEAGLTVQVLVLLEPLVPYKVLKNSTAVQAYLPVFLPVKLMLSLNPLSPKIKESDKTINELQWIQFQLDNFETITEVIDNLSTLKISKLLPALNLHYFICDKNGDCVTVEFWGGKAFPLRIEDGFPPLLNNYPYSISINILKEYLPFGGKRKVKEPEIFSPNYEATIQFNSLIRGNLPIPNNMTERFAYMAVRINNDQITNEFTWEDYAFDTFAIDPIPWLIVYNPNSGEIFFKTRENSSKRCLNITAFDYDCKTPSKVLDIDSGEDGDVSNLFQDYNQEINRELIEYAFSGKNFPKNPCDSESKFSKYCDGPYGWIYQKIYPLMLKSLPKNSVTTLENYPETTECVQSSQ